MSATSGATRVAGIIGWPVSSSLSPAIHNAAFTAAGLDWVYVAFPVHPERVAEALAGVRALGIAGLNVTMPHKQAVIPYLDGLTPEVERVGAVNTISIEDGRLIGSNTDGAGFVLFLQREAGIDPTGVDVLLLGAGGAARGLAAALTDAGALVTVAARRREQADEVAAITGARPVGWDEVSPAAVAAAVVVNTTPVGRDRNVSPLPAEAVSEGQTIIDLIYHPVDTELVRIATERGARPYNGLGMLVHQAALAFEIWTGVPAPFDAMSAAVR